MKIRRVAFDMDGTLSDFMKAAVPMFKEHYDLEPDYTKTDVYAIEEVFGLTKETRPPDMRKRMFEDLHLFLQLPPVEGMDRVVARLRDRGVKTYVMTARTPTPTIVEDTCLWLQRHNFVVDDVFFTHEKAELCTQMGVGVMVEDELGHISSLRAMGVDVVVPDHSWNRNLPDDSHYVNRVGGRVVRVAGWREALRSIEEFLE